MSDRDTSRLKETASQFIRVCLHTQAWDLLAPWETSINGRQPSAWVNWRKSSRNFLVRKCRTVVTCQLYFIRGKNPSFYRCLCAWNPLVRRASSWEWQQKAEMLCLSAFVLVVGKRKKNEDSVPQSRKTDYYNILIITPTSPTCGMFVPYSPFRNASLL